MDELEDYCVEAPENAFPAFEEGVSYQKIVAVILRNPQKKRAGFESTALFRIIQRELRKNYRWY